MTYMSYTFICICFSWGTQPATRCLHIETAPRFRWIYWKIILTQLCRCNCILIYAFPKRIYVIFSQNKSPLLMKALNSVTFSSLVNSLFHAPCLLYRRDQVVHSKADIRPLTWDVIKWRHFPCYWPFVRGIHRSPLNSPQKGQRRGDLMFYLICAWINGWVNNREAVDLRHHRAHYEVVAMELNKRCHGILLSPIETVFYVLHLSFWCGAGEAGPSPNF